MSRFGIPALLLSAALAPPTAQAQPRPGERERVAITLVAGSDVPQSWLWEVRAALRRSGGALPRQLGSAGTSPAPSSVREELSAATEEAERRFRQADFEGCVSTTTDAERRLALPLAEQGLLRELSGLASMAAVCEVKRGATQVAADRASLALALDPDLVVDPARFPPDVAELFEEARRTRASSAAVRLELDAGLPDAMYEVDGREARAVVEVMPGPHYVAARAPGTRVSLRPVVIAGPERVGLELEPVTSAAARLEVGAPVGSAGLDAGLVRAAALASGATRVLTIAAAPRGQIVLVLREVRDLHVTELGNARARAPTTAAGWTGLLGALHASLRPLPPPRRETSSGGSFWLWAAGAAAVVAAGTAITFALLLDEPVVDNYELQPGGFCLSGECVCDFPCKR